MSQSVYVRKKSSYSVDEFIEVVQMLDKEDLEAMVVWIVLERFVKNNTTDPGKLGIEVAQKLSKQYEKTKKFPRMGTIGEVMSMIRKLQ